MREDNFQRIYLLTQGVIALGTLGIAISICVSIYNFKEAQESNRIAQESNRQAHEWYRRSYTVDIIRDFEGHVVSYRIPLQEAFPGLFNQEKRGILEPGTAENLWLGKAEPNSKYDFMRDKKNVLKMKNQLIGLFNYMEYLAQTYNEHVVDQPAFEESLADPMIFYHDTFYEFIKASQKQLRYPNWQPVLNTVAYIKTKRNGNLATPKPAIEEEKSSSQSK
jgi:hypothetical protein